MALPSPFTATTGEAHWALLVRARAAGLSLEDILDMLSAKPPAYRFAYMLEKRPGAFVLMGNGTSGSHAQPLHNPSYDFNDEAIAFGVEYWCALAKRALAE